MVRVDRKEKGRKRNHRTGFYNILRKKADVLRILDHYKVRNLTTSGSWINGSCPLPTHTGPDNNPSFGMQVAKGSELNGRFKCFSCGGGDVFKFIQLMEKTDFREALDILKQFSSGGELYSLSILEKEIGELEEEEVEEEKQPLISTFIPKMWKDDLLVARYLVRNKKRRFDIKSVGEIINQFDIGLANYRWATRIIVPIKDEFGNWITFFAQNPLDNQDKLFAKNAPTGRLLFSIDEWKGNTNKIILAESVWDCLKIISFGYPCISSFSTSFTTHQAELILNHFEICAIAFDADEAGNKGISRVVDFLLPSVSLWHIALSDGKDPCDCSQNEFREAVKGAKKLEGDSWQSEAL